MPVKPDDDRPQRGIERLASAERALGKVDIGLRLVDTLFLLGERAGLPLLPAVCGAARDVLQVVQKSRTVINDVLVVAQRTVDILELLQLMANNVERMDVSSRESVEGRMRELQGLLEDVRSAVAAFGKQGWLWHALNVGRRTTLSQLDSEITGQLDLLLKFYNLTRDARIDAQLQAREYAVEAEVLRQVAERKAMGEAVDANALEKDSEVVRGIAVASGVSDAEFQEELRSEMREGFASTGVKLDEIKTMMEKLSTGSAASESVHSSRLSLYEYDRKPNAPPSQKDKLAARLGRGSFGVTYRMRKVAGIDARRYAIKMIETEELDGSVLENEARLLSLLEHENTLRFYDAFWHDTDDGLLFVIVTELLTGGSLAEKIAAAPPLQPAEVAALMRQVASGLAYMHSLNLQHRDLKPANVMLDSTGRAKIIDFGLACVSSASHRSRTKTRVGTDVYMSPEKAVGKRYGPPDDVWAAGCILAELLLGRTIGNVALDAAKRQRAITEGKSASERLCSWVEGCLQESPGRRPAAGLLEQGLADEAVDRSRWAAFSKPSVAAFHRLFVKVGGLLEGALKSDRLDWSEKNLDAEDATVVAYIVSVSEVLKALSLRDNNIGDEGAKALAYALRINGVLTNLALMNNNIGDEGATALASALRVNEVLMSLIAGNAVLTSLDVSGNKIGPTGATAIAEALRANAVLTTLDLSGNEICGIDEDGDGEYDASGIVALADALKVNAVLTELWLGGNEIGDEGAAALASALRVNGVLTNLNLRWNDIGDEGATALASALRFNGVLTELDLGGNEIGDEGATALASALEVNGVLNILNLSYNGIGPEGAKAIGEALAVNEVLNNIALRGNSLGDEGGRVIRDAVSGREGFKLNM